MFVYRRRARRRIRWDINDWQIAGVWVAASTAVVVTWWRPFPSPDAVGWMLVPPVLGIGMSWLWRRSLFEAEGGGRRHRAAQQDVSRLYVQLLMDLESAGVPVNPSIQATDLPQLVGTWAPAAQAEIRDFVGFYLAARFSGQAPAVEDVRAWGKRLRVVRKVVRAAIKAAARGS